MFILSLEQQNLGSDRELQTTGDFLVSWDQAGSFLARFGMVFSSYPCWNVVGLHPKINSTVYWKDWGSPHILYQSAKKIPGLRSCAVPLVTSYVMLA